MKLLHNQPVKDRRDIGQVVSLIDKIQAAREMSSCCVGVEALLETRNQIEARAEKKRSKSKR